MKRILLPLFLGLWITMTVAPVIYAMFSDQNVPPQIVIAGNEEDPAEQGEKDGFEKEFFLDQTPAVSLLQAARSSAVRFVYEQPPYWVTREIHLPPPESC